MNFSAAQENMRNAYFSGGPGVLASGLVWLAAGLTAFISSEQSSVLLFFLGGMLIHPAGIMLSKALKRSGQHDKENPLGRLALESTFLLFVGLFIAYSLLSTQQEFFFPIMLMIIGARYLIFSTLYGLRIYWVLGLILAGSGLMGFYLPTAFYVPALLGGTIELVFGLAIILTEKRKLSAA